MSNLIDRSLTEHYRAVAPMTGEALGILNESAPVSEDNDDYDYDSEVLEEIFGLFGAMVDPDEDLELQLEAFLDEYYEMDDTQIAIVKKVLIELVEASGLEGTDDDAISFLQQLAKPMEFERGGINQSGMTVPDDQIGTKALLAMHPVSKVKDVFGNKSFSFDRYSYFPRGQNHYGHEAEFKDPSQAYN